MRGRFAGLLIVVTLMSIGSASGAILFQDDFNDGTYADTWETYGGNSIDAGDGSLALDSGFGLDDTRAVLKSDLWNPNWKEYVVDFDFKIGQTDYGYSPHMALLFNVQAIAEGYDRGQYYQFYSFREAAGLIRMESLDARAVTGLGYHPYITAGRSDLELDTWYHARLVVQQDTIQGFIGHLDGTYLDTPMFTFDTSGITAEYAYNGPVALKAIGGATNRYDNLVVSGNVVPEPTSLLVWGLMGLVAIGIRCSRCRNRKR